MDEDEDHVAGCLGFGDCSAKFLSVVALGVDIIDARGLRQEGSGSLSARSQQQQVSSYTSNDGHAPCPSPPNPHSGPSSRALRSSCQLLSQVWASEPLRQCQPLQRAHSLMNQQLGASKTHKPQEGHVGDSRLAKGRLWCKWHSQPANAMPACCSERIVSSSPSSPKSREWLLARLTAAILACLRRQWGWALQESALASPRRTAKRTS